MHLLCISAKRGTARKRRIFGPAQITENQCSQKGKTTFETFSTTSNVFFLMSYVSIRASGSIFEMWGMPFRKRGAAPVVSDCEVMSAELVIEDIYTWESLYVLREA